MTLSPKRAPVGGGRCAGVSGGSADGLLAAIFDGFGHGEDHAAVLERAGGIASLQFEVEFAHAQLFGYIDRFDQRRIALSK